MVSKSEVRTKMLDARDSQPVYDTIEKSKLIKENFFTEPVTKDAKSVFIYNAIRGEVKTRDIIGHLLAENKTVAVPVVNCDTMEIIVAKLHSLNELKKGMFGIKEPARTEPMSLEDIDLVVVPGVAFDEKGRRIGHGFGFYDKFLSTLKDKPIIALAYEMQILDKIECENHDINVNAIVTENRVIKCDK